MGILRLVGLVLAVAHISIIASFATIIGMDIHPNKIWIASLLFLISILYVMFCSIKGLEAMEEDDLQKST